MVSPTTPNPAASCLDPNEPGLVHADAALQTILAACTPITQRVHLPLKQAGGRILAQDLVAPLNVPPQDNSAMDGFAIRAADLPETGFVELRVTGRAMAGIPFAGVLAPGECARIMTGAPIPEGADTVVIQERTTYEGNRVRLDAGQRPGQNIRRRGEDIQAGSTVLPAGHRLMPADLGLIASVGLPEVQVLRRPRVVFLSTGDELRALGAPLQTGQIYDSNRYVLQGLLDEAGVESLDLGVVRDQPGVLAQTLADAARAGDVVITTGGVSVGEADHVKQSLAEQGEMLLWKVAIKPGRPLAFGILEGGAYCFGLPGNPVAVMVTFQQFVRPALERLSGQTPREPLRFQVPCLSALKKQPGRTEFQRGRLQRDATGRLCVELTGRQGSGVLHSMSRADCLIVLGHDQGPVAAGESVTVQPLPGMY